MVTQFNAGFEEHGIEIEHFMPGADGVYVKKVKIPAGKVLQGAIIDRRGDEAGVSLMTLRRADPR